MVNLFTLVTEFAAIFLGVQGLGLDPYYTVPLAVVVLIILAVTGSHLRWERSVMIDSRKAKGVQVDYLQVFELSIARKDCVPVQKLIHRQEFTTVRDAYYLPMIETPIKVTI